MCSGSLSGLDTGMKACCPVKPFVGGSRVCDTQADTWENGGLKEGAKTLEKIGGAEGDRTLGLMTASHALSQLSYSPTSGLVYHRDRNCQ